MSDSPRLNDLVTFDTEFSADEIMDALDPDRVLFEYVERIGAGSNKVMHRVRLDGDDRAIPVPKRDVVSSNARSFLDKGHDMLYEKQIHARLDSENGNPHIVPFKDVRNVTLRGINLNLPVYGYAPGVDVDSYVDENGPLGFTQFFDVFSGVLSASQHHVNHGLFHRDIKLDNIRFDPSNANHSFLTDYQLAAPFDPATGAIPRSGNSGDSIQTMATRGSRQTFDPLLMSGTDYTVQSEIYALAKSMLDALVPGNTLRYDPGITKEFDAKKHNLALDELLHLDRILSLDKLVEVGKNAYKRRVKKQEVVPVQEELNVFNGRNDFSQASSFQKVAPVLRKALDANPEKRFASLDEFVGKFNSAKLSLVEKVGHALYSAKGVLGVTCIAATVATIGYFQATDMIREANRVEISPIISHNEVDVVNMQFEPKLKYHPFGLSSSEDNRRLQAANALRVTCESSNDVGISVDLGYSDFAQRDLLPLDLAGRVYISGHSDGVDISRRLRPLSKSHETGTDVQNQSMRMYSSYTPDIHMSEVIPPSLYGKPGTYTLVVEFYSPGEKRDRASKPRAPDSYEFMNDKMVVAKGKTEFDLQYDKFEDDLDRYEEEQDLREIALPPKGTVIARKYVNVVIGEDTLPLTTSHFEIDYYYPSQFASGQTDVKYHQGTSSRYREPDSLYGEDGMFIHQDKEIPLDQKFYFWDGGSIVELDDRDHDVLSTFNPFDLGRATRNSSDFTGYSPMEGVLLVDAYIDGKFAARNLAELKSDVIADSYQADFEQLHPTIKTQERFIKARTALDNYLTQVRETQVGLPDTN